MKPRKTQSNWQKPRKKPGKPDQTEPNGPKPAPTRRNPRKLGKNSVKPSNSKSNPVRPGTTYPTALFFRHHLVHQLDVIETTKEVELFQNTAFQATVGACRRWSVSPWAYAQHTHTHTHDGKPGNENPVKKSCGGIWNEMLRKGSIWNRPECGAICWPPVQLLVPKRTLVSWSSRWKLDQKPAIIESKLMNVIVSRKKRNTELRVYWIEPTIWRP